MKVTIIGWYGTETMGDRAILDGILKVLATWNKIDTVFLGSLYPFYSNRTLFEEQKVFHKTAPKINIVIFDVRRNYKWAIEQSQLLIFGGGPLMDLEELFLMKKVFITAHKKKIKKCIMGCGIGPLYNPVYRNTVREIFDMSDGISVRDNESWKETLQPPFNDCYDVRNIGDPAIVSIENYEQQSFMHQSDSYIAINFREYPINEYGESFYWHINDFIKVVELASEKYSKVKLYPMHTFSIGGDDRKFLSKILLQCADDKKNIEVVHKPMNLHELYCEFSNARACIGMRYHAVLMQTILNGNNAILNYTDKLNGKIPALLADIKGKDFYRTRIRNLKDSAEKPQLEELFSEISQERRFLWKKSDILEQYVSFIDSLFES